MNQFSIPYTINPNNYKECMTLNITPEKLVRFLSTGKVTGIARHHIDIYSLVIGSNTIVSTNNKILGRGEK